MQRTVDNQQTIDRMQGKIGSVLPQLKQLVEHFKALSAEFESKLLDLTELVRQSSTKGFAGLTGGALATRPSGRSCETGLCRQCVAFSTTIWDQQRAEFKMLRVGNLVQVTSVNTPMLRTFGNMWVSAFHARGGSKSTPIAYQLEIVRSCKARMFQYGIQPDSQKGRHAWRDCSPSSPHLRKPSRPFVDTSYATAMTERYIQAALEDKANKDLQGLASECRSGWCTRSTR